MLAIDREASLGARGATPPRSEARSGTPSRGLAAGADPESKPPEAPRDERFSGRSPLAAVDANDPRSDVVARGAGDAKSSSRRDTDDARTPAASLDAEVRRADDSARVAGADENEAAPASAHADASSAAASETDPSARAVVDAQASALARLRRRKANADRLADELLADANAEISRLRLLLEASEASATRAAASTPRRNSPSKVLALEDRVATLERMLREAEIAGANARMRAEGVGAAVAAAKGAEEAARLRAEHDAATRRAEEEAQLAVRWARAAAKEEAEAHLSLIHI